MPSTRCPDPALEAQVNSRVAQACGELPSKSPEPKGRHSAEESFTVVPTSARVEKMLDSEARSMS